MPEYKPPFTLTSFHLNFHPVHYCYADRTGNLTAEAVGVVKGEKHFPVFEGGMVFKPLTKSKPFSTPLFAYAEVFWSEVIRGYFVEAPQYRLAFCEGYEKEVPKYYDYGTVSPLLYQAGESLLNLLEFFRMYPDEKVDIDQYVNYCQMFYDYTTIFEATYFQEHPQIAKELAMQVLLSILKGDQNYHYENVAFLCGADGEIHGMEPMIDHEFSTCFMFPDDPVEHLYWFGQLQRSIEGREAEAHEFDFLSRPEERALMEKSVMCLHRNLSYIREHYPDVTAVFLEKLRRLDADLAEHPEAFYLQKAADYPDKANSYAYRIGKARYKDQDEEQAKRLEAQYAGKEKKIDFVRVSRDAVHEIRLVIFQLRDILEG